MVTTRNKNNFNHYDKINVKKCQEQQQEASKQEQQQEGSKQEQQQEVSKQEQQQEGSKQEQHQQRQKTTATKPSISLFL
jgi:hypothetical protein